jgi:hypothetical protein
MVPPAPLLTLSQPSACILSVAGQLAQKTYQSCPTTE